jgi:predicted ATPase
VPVLVIREQESQQWVPVNELSSGMQKVLLILTDLFILPNHSIYIIDEYENSLGINAINFFPDFLLEFDKSIQFLITSHHPYIINQIPVKNWHVLHRDGTKVTIQQGDNVVARYGQSRQQAFIQLLNDPFYNMHPQ